MTEMKRKVGDDAVFKATGKGWKPWFAALDEAGARELDHKGIVAWLGENTDMSGWWQQLVAAPLGVLYGAWSDARRRGSWLGQTITVRKATKDKSMRVTWPDDTHLDVYFQGKGPGKSAVTVNHRKLADAKQAESMKAWWADRLAVLKEYVER